MSGDQNQIQHLQQRLADLQKRQEEFQNEFLQIHKDIEKLKESQEVHVPETGFQKASPAEFKFVDPINPEPVKTPPPPKPDSPDKKGESQSSLERFIGENLINKIGIIITVIGVAIGAKYAIDNELIKPVTRVIMGYLVGAGLFIFAYRLKEKYENFSAVLLSGSMAIMYFITYAAYGFYNMYPQTLAFILMVVFTAFTVMAAISYNREVIAIIGLVGAAAVPFLLSDATDSAVILFIYTAIINAGILVISVKKYWKPLYFSAFGLTWIIYFTWFFNSYKAEKDTSFALVFSFIFFAIFYLTFLSYKLIRKEKFNIFDIILLLANSFIFYGVSYALIKDVQSGDKYLGILTLGNAVIHLLVSGVIYKNKLADRNLFYMVSGLFLVFVTIAIPVQLDGNWVTLLWVLMGFLLFYIGRTKGAHIYEYLAYPLIALSFMSLIQDWGKMQMKAFDREEVYTIVPILNIYFMSAILYLAALGGIVWLNLIKKFSSPFKQEDSTRGILDFGFPGLLIVVLYFTFSLEISAWFNHLYVTSRIQTSGIDEAASYISNKDINSFKMIWRVNLSLLYIGLLTLVNLKYIKNRLFGTVLFWTAIVTMVVFLTQSLYLLSELRENYLNQFQAEYYPRTSFSIIIRYISFIFVVILLIPVWQWIKREEKQELNKTVFSLLVHATILWILCSEMLNIMDLLRNDYTYRFGLSILAGGYALLLIVLGISGKKKHLRIAGIVLMGVTLVKLFFYDMTRLDIMLKTILFLALGGLLLVISFLYNKNQKHMYGEEEQEAGS